MATDTAVDTPQSSLSGVARVLVNAGKLDVTAASPFDLLVEGGILRNGRSEKI